jgi:hypothetical protein
VNKTNTLKRAVKSRVCEDSMGSTLAKQKRPSASSIFTLGNIFIDKSYANVRVNMALAGYLIGPFTQGVYWIGQLPWGFWAFKCLLKALV